MTASSIVLSPPAPDAPCASDLLGKGRDHLRNGELHEAIAAFQAGLALAAARSITGNVVADLHAALGNAFMLSGDLESAADNYKAALRLAPHLVACWCNLGNIHLKTGMAEQAIALYVEALRRNPAHRPSRTNLVQALLATGQRVLAKALLRELLDETPDDVQLHGQLGRICYELGENDEAIAHFERAMAIEPAQAEHVYWLAAVRQAMGETDAALAAYARATEMCPVMRRPAAASPAAFRALVLFAPFVGNTPVDLLFKDCAYDTDILSLLPASAPDIGSVAGSVDVVLNLVSDADQGAEILPLAADIVRRLGKPTVNDPARILDTTRERTAAVLAGIPGCRMPVTSRIAAGDLSLPGEFDLTFPVLARPAGTHGGDCFEKFEDGDALKAFLEGRAHEDRYLIEYIDFRSADGFFRKYRFIFVDEQILPYHLAIGTEWKLHRDSTDMGAHEWMQREEERFLRDPDAIFHAGHQEILRTIRQRIGLDYFGIDCALDAKGNLVVFEVNASMLIHDNDPDFPYKAPLVRRIKVAFDAMLERMARREAVCGDGSQRTMVSRSQA